MEYVLSADSLLTVRLLRTISAKQIPLLSDTLTTVHCGWLREENINIFLFFIGTPQWLWQLAGVQPG